MKCALFSPELAPKLFGRLELDLKRETKSAKLTKKKIVKKVVFKNPKLYKMHMKELVDVPEGF